MTRSTTVCGKAKYHEGLHGSWTVEAEHWQCRTVAEPRIVETHVGLWKCQECWALFASSTNAKHHWWRSHVRLRKLAAIKHGTEPGYHAHIRRQEATCRPCKDAHATHNLKGGVT